MDKAIPIQMTVNNLSNMDNQQSKNQQSLNLNSINNSNNLSLNETASQEEKDKLVEIEIKNLLEEIKGNQPITAEAHIKRLLNTNFISPYEVLNLSNEVTEEEVKKQFRQLTMLLHPDKCSDPNSTQAFHGKFNFFFFKIKLGFKFDFFWNYS